MAVGLGSIWVGDFGDHRILRLDPQTRRGVFIPTGRGPIAIAVTPTAVWTANYGSNNVTRIDPGTNRPVGEVEVGSEPDGIAVAAGRVFVANQLSGTVSVIDPGTDRVVKDIPLGPASPSFMAALDGEVWVPDFTEPFGHVVVIDARTLRVMARIRLGNSPLAVSFGAGSAWVTNIRDGSVSRLDPRTHSIQATIEIPGAQPQGVAIGLGFAWVSSITGNVYRVDVGTNEVTGVIALSGGPRDVRFVGSHLWVNQFELGRVSEVGLSSQP